MDGCPYAPGPGDTWGMKPRGPFIPIGVEVASNTERYHAVLCVEVLRPVRRYAWRCTYWAHGNGGRTIIVGPPFFLQLGGRDAHRPMAARYPYNAARHW